MFKFIRSLFPTKAVESMSQRVELTKGPMEVFMHYEDRHEELSKKSVSLIQGLLQPVLDAIENDFAGISNHILCNVSDGAHTDLPKKTVIGIDGLEYAIDPTIHHESDMICGKVYPLQLILTFYISQTPSMTKDKINLISYYQGQAQPYDLKSKYHGSITNAFATKLVDEDVFLVEFTYDRRDQVEYV